LILEEAIVDMLTDDNAVKAITTRIFPVMIPQDSAYPLITYQRISGLRDTVMEGPSGFAHPRMQIDSYAKTYAGAKELAGAVRQALYGKTYFGDGVRIGSIVMLSDSDFFEPAIGCHRVSADYMIWHEE